MEKIKHILMVCGEASGDLNASGLARKLFEINPSLKISAVGGELLRKAGANVFYDIKELSVIGFFDVIKKLPKFFALKKLVLEKINSEKPDAIILVDFSGFNLRLAKSINKKIPVVYFVSPQVWASRQGRVKTIKEYVDLMVVLFKFEEEFYKKFGVKAALVGHPLLDIVRPSADRKQFLDGLKLHDKERTIALLPGSRKQEVRKILPVMLDSALIISKALADTQFIVVKSPHVDWRIYHPITHRYKINLKVVEDNVYDCMNIADFCMVASGTATLETAIMQKPFVVIYKMGILNYLLYRPQVKVPYIGMVNIVAGKEVVPEFIQFNAAPYKIADAVIKLLNSPSELQKITKELSLVKSSLGSSGASEKAAKVITEFLERL